MRSLPIAAAAAAAVVGSALALAQDPAQQKATVASTTTDNKTATKEAAPAPSEFKDLKSRASYLVGFNLAQQLKASGIDFDPEAMLKGIKDVQAGASPR